MTKEKYSMDDIMNKRDYKIFWYQVFHGLYKKNPDEDKYVREKSEKRDRME